MNNNDKIRGLIVLSITCGVTRTPLGNQPVRRIGPALLLVLLTMTCVVGCETQAPPLRVATVQWVGYQPLHLARSLGDYDGLNLRLADFLSNTESLRAFRNGNVEVAALTLDEVMLLNSEGHDVKIILVMDYSQGGDAIVGRPDIDGLADLKGRRVGVESTAAGAYLLARALEFAGLDTSDVEIVNLGAEAQEQAYRNGRVDAFATFEPIRTRLLKLGARELFNSTRMPGEIVDVLAVHKDLIEQRPRELTRLLQGWFRAIDYARTHPDATAQQLAAPLNLTPEEYLAAAKGMQFPSKLENCRLLGGDAGKMQQTVNSLHEFMYSNGLLRQPEPATELFSDRILQRLDCTGAAG